MDKEQYFVLNEKVIEDIFWPAEKKLRHLSVKCEGALKTFVVNDCCREDYIKLRNSLETDLERSERLTKEDQVKLEKDIEINNQLEEKKTQVK